MKTIKYYQVDYTKWNGQQGSLNVIARNEHEAIANAKDNCFTGKDFFVVMEIPPTKDTVKGGGSHRMN